MRTFKTFLLVAMVLMLAAPVFAQQGPDPRGPIPGAFEDEGDIAAGPQGDGPGGGVSEERREEIRKKIETVRIYRLTEELRLDPQTAGKLAALLGSADRKRRDIGREQFETMRELRASLRAKNPDEKKLKGLLDRLEKNHLEMAAARDKELKGLKEVLTVEQQARYLLFQREFQRDIRRMIDQARDGDRRQRPGMRGGDGRDRPGRQLR
jgi:Spy/CpxP family protein refolding chaperone